MKTFSIYRRIFALLLCLALFSGFSASVFADSGTDGFIDPDALQKLVDDYAKERGVDPKAFSVGYIYLATGEEWYHNGDTWYYPASMYKVPLMMLMAEKVYNGEITPDTDLGGYTVATAEEYIISYSNNDYAHTVRRYLGGDEAWRQEAKKFSSLADNAYSPDYIDYCYFSPRYITQVVNTLYSDSARFPNIIECMLAAEPGHYFRLNEDMNANYDIAQKYGSYCDSYGDNFNHNTGIIYTPQPFILTVMTLNVPSYEKFISDIAVMLTDYTLSLSQGLEAYEQEQAEAQALAAQEQAEAERIAAEEKAAAEKALAESIAEAEAMAQRESEAAARRSKILKLGIVAVIVLLLVVVLCVLLAKRRKRKRMEEFERRFHAEMQQYRRRG